MSVRALSSLALVAALSLGGAARAADQETQAPLTEARVEAMLRESDAAANRRDVAGVMSHIASDAVIDVQMPGPDGRTTRLRWTAQEYLQNALSALDGVSGYDLARKNTRIRIEPDGRRAVVDCELHELFTSRGVSVRGVTREHSLLELRGGRLQAVQIQSVVVEMGPASGSPAAREH